jgi:uncharacterized membrane protein
MLIHATTPINALMSNPLYDVLALAGFSHPIHPVFVHVPSGLSIGALCLALWSLVTGQRTYTYQMIVVAMIFALLAIPIGIIDWQRFYGGAWIFEIKMKLALAAVYLALLLVSVAFGRRHNDSPAMLPLHGLCVLSVMGLGFFGGQLVYHGFTPDAPEQFNVGRHVFESNCSGCHRRGENIIEPNLPLRNASQLENFKDFVNYVRDPHMPDGSPGLMPQFTPEKLSDAEAKQLYDYLYFAFKTEKRTSN